MNALTWLRRIVEWEREQGTGGARLARACAVALALFHHADRAGGSCHPSGRTVSERSGVKRDAVTALRRRWIDSGWLVDTGRKAGRGGAVVYELAIPEPAPDLGPVPGGRAPRTGTDTDPVPDPELAPFSDGTGPHLGPNWPPFGRELAPGGRNDRRIDSEIDSDRRSCGEREQIDLSLGDQPRPEVSADSTPSDLPPASANSRPKRKSGATVAAFLDAFERGAGDQFLRPDKLDGDTAKALGRKWKVLREAGHTLEDVEAAGRHAAGWHTNRPIVVGELLMRTWLADQITEAKNPGTGRNTNGRKANRNGAAWRAPDPPEAFREGAHNALGNDK